MFTYVKDGLISDLPVVVQTVLFALVRQADQLNREISGLEKGMSQWHRSDADSARLATIPGDTGDV